LDDLLTLLRGVLLHGRAVAGRRLLADSRYFALPLVDSLERAPVELQIASWLAAVDVAAPLALPPVVEVAVEPAVTPDAFARAREMAGPTAAFRFSFCGRDWFAGYAAPG